MRHVSFVSFVSLVVPLAACAALAACSDDSSPPPGADSKVDAVVMDSSAGQDGIADTSVTPDSSLADQAAADQAPTGDSSGAPKLLTSAHTGWQAKDCFTSGCHTKPIKGHTATSPPQCATCHGGNGACKPNGTGSTKKNHSETSCQSSNCHGTKHGFSTKTDCISCHFASQGTLDCP